MIDAQEFLGRAVAAETVGAAETVVHESDADDVDACREAALRRWTRRRAPRGRYVNA